MINLPHELVIEILNHLCYHCQNSGHFPNADAPEIRSGKQALARLCRTSKALCAMAQPILYHYYATGNRGQSSWGSEATNDLFPHFIKTISTRPDLASRVQVMEIVSIDTYWVSIENNMSVLKELLQIVRSEDLIALEPDLDEDDEKDVPESRRACERIHLRMFLVALALTLTSNLSRVLFALDDDHSCSLLYGLENFKFRQVRTLATVGNHTDYHLFDLGFFFDMFPDLHTLYACDAAGWYSCSPRTGRERHEWFDQGEFANLKKLALGELLPNELIGIIADLQQLEDFEYYFDSYALYGGAMFDLQDLLEWVRPTLKRLCIAFRPGNTSDILENLSTEDDLQSTNTIEFPSLIYLPDVDYPPFRSLSRFVNLEELEIDCRSIYRKSDPDTPNRLLDFLPRRIRRFRIFWVYRCIEVGMEGLAIGARDRFPDLKEVVIGFPPAPTPKPKFVERIEQVKNLAGLFERNGIRFAWKTDAVGPEPKTMIPGAMVGKHVNVLPSVSDREG